MFPIHEYWLDMGHMEEFDQAKRDADFHDRRQTIVGCYTCKEVVNVFKKKFMIWRQTGAWTIEAALGSKYIDRVIVSTDDEKLQNFKRFWG